MTDRLTYLSDNIDLIRQGTGAIQLLGQDRYSGRGQTDDVSPPGAHFRHVFDFYRAFLDGFSVGRVNYDARERDPRIERNVDLAIGTANSLAEDIGSLPVGRLSQPIDVSANVILDGKSVVDWTPSTVQRELMYLLSHTVHHYAIIRLLAARTGIELDRHFGVAPSTLAHRRLDETCAPSAG